MKKRYLTPKSKAFNITLEAHLFESSYIPVGSKGPFDVKEEQKDWNIWQETTEE